MRLVIFGAGAVGSLLGARLATAGTAVILVARPAHVLAIQERGLQIEDTSPLVVRLAAVDHLAEPTDADAVLLTVKTFDLDSAVVQLVRAFPQGVPIIAIQNGLGVAERLTTHLTENGWPDAKSLVMRAVSSVPATFVSPGSVRPGGRGEILLSGVDGLAVPAVAERLRSALVESGVPVRLVPDLEHEVWRKAVVNAAINPVTADHQIPNGSLAVDPWRGQALALLGEARKAAHLAGHDFTAEESERDLWTVVKATATNRSSMLQDLDRGRPTEIDSISGELLAVARRHGISLPATERAVRRVHDRVARAARDPSRATGRAQPS